MASYRPDGRPRTAVGPQVIVRIPGLDGDDGLIGRGSDWGYTEDLGVTPINEFGKYGPQEYVHTNYSAMMTLNLYRILGKPYELLTVEGRPFIPRRSQIGMAVPVDFDMLTAPDQDPPETALTHARYCLNSNRDVSGRATDAIGFGTRFTVVEIVPGEI